jgi:hypothetical protein
MWVSQIVTGIDQPYILIGLPVMESGRVLTGSLVFHPASAAVDGATVFTRFSLNWSDDERSGKQAGSNGVRFGLSADPAAGLNLTGGEVQLLEPSAASLSNGQALSIGGDFFAPNEVVTFWYTDNAGNSKAIGSRTADATGSASVSFTPGDLLEGNTYVVAAYGNRSGIYGNSTLTSIT